MKSSWIWNRYRLCQLTGKTLQPVTFYAIQLLALSPQQKLFSKHQSAGGGNDFVEFMV